MSAVVFAAVLFASAAPQLPVARAPFERVGGTRQPVELLEWSYRRGTFSPSAEQYVWTEFAAGDKSVLLNGEDGRVRGNGPTWYNRIGVYAGKDSPMRRGKHLLAKLAIVLPGETGWKDVADTNDWRAVDRARLTAGWGRGWKLDDGGTAQFRYEMRPNGPGKVALGYDAGAEDAVIAAQKGKSGFQLQFTVPKGVAFRADKGSPALELEPDDPERHVTISLARAPGWTAEGKDGSTVVIWWVSSRRGEIAFDFHESSAPKLKPTPQQGEIDFWTTDALHVPVKPGRNRVTNGSFEQGLVGWWYAGYQWDGWSVAQMKKLGDAPQRIVVDGGVHGRKSLRYRVNGNGLVEGFRSLPMALKAGRVHTLSIWARGEPERDAVTLGVHPRAVGEQNKVKPAAKGKPTGIWRALTKDWTRYAVSFVPDEGGVAVTLNGWGTGWIQVDGLQVEEGDTATEYDDVPVSGDLRTSDPDNYLYKGRPIEARLALTGRAGLAGKVRATLVNYYSETVFDETIPFALGADGTAVLPLAFDAQRLGTGVFALRTDFAADGKEWTDYRRLQVIEPLGTKHPTARFFAHFPWFRTGSRYADMPRRMRDYGIGGTSWAVNDEYAKEPYASLYREVGMVNKVHVLQSEFPRFDPQNFGWRKPGFAAYSNDVARILAFIEKAAYESGRTCHEDDVYWALGNEEELGNPIIKVKKDYEAYFERQMAAYRGLKRAFDERGLKLMYGPTHGTCSYNPRSFSREVMDGYLDTALKHGFRYDFVSVHMYWAMDGAGLLGSFADRDENAAALVEALRKRGYPETTPILFTESSNMLPMYVPQWGAVDWSDHYTGTIPSAAFGNREFVHAGTIARIYLMDLKRWPRVCLTHTWQRWIVWDLAHQPFCWPMTVNVIGRLLPDPRFVGEARPFPTVRGYCYHPTPAAKEGVMAVWTTDLDVENGVCKGETLTVRLPEDVTFTDLMGNPRSARRTSGGASLVPLTSAPLFVQSADAEGLVKAFAAARSDRVAKVAAGTETAKALPVPGRVSLSGKGAACAASAELAWDGTALRVKVAAKGLKAPQLTLGIDGLGNARQVGVAKLGPDDSLYEFRGGEVTRVKAVNTQFADGTTNAADDGEVRRDFGRKWTPSADGGTWELTIVPRFLMPVRLEKGVRFGLALAVRDGETEVSLSGCDLADPRTWQLFELR